MIFLYLPTAGGELCEAFSCIAERSREAAACYFAGSMVKYLYPIPKFYESGETMLDFRPICLEDRAWIEPVMQAAAGHGSEFSFVNLYLWGDQRVASVDGTPVFLSNFSGSLTYPWPVGCRDLPGTLELLRQDACERGIPLRLFGLTLPEPVWPMVLAFAWPLIRPSMLAPAVLFGLGVFLDFFWGGQTGMWALSLLLIYGAMLLASKYLAGQATIVLFALYVASTGLAFAVAYFVTRGSLGNAPNLLAVMGQMIPTLLLFPLADWLIERFDDADVRFR